MPMLLHAKNGVRLNDNSGLSKRKMGDALSLDNASEGGARVTKEENYDES